ncbi:hypothetical protein AMECASPLE_015196 [Ameca splendens]|uniref:Uncharacterized protein n=1 Tax=Ameca splendens TaxID=208324 RepID=A0ABV0Z059_9TELE
MSTSFAYDFLCKTEYIKSIYEYQFSSLNRSSQLNESLGFCALIQTIGLYSGALGSSVAFSKKILDSNLGPVSFCMEFAYSPRAFIGSLRVLPLPPTVQNDDY